MKKTFTTLLAALALLAFFIPSMTAVGQTRADVVLSTCRFGSDYNANNSGYTGTFTVTNGGYTWTVGNGNNNNNGWTNDDGYGQIKFGRKNVASVGYITTDAKYSSAVTKVNVTIDALTASKINSIKLYTSSDNSTWNEAGSFTKATGTQSVSLSSPAANLYYKVEFDCASGSGNGLITVSKVEYYHNVSATTDPTITFNNGSVNVGKTLDLSTLFTSNSSGAVSYSITTGGSYATLSGSTLTGVAVGSVTVEASQAAAGSYNAGSATATITVNAAPTLSSIAITTPPTKTTYTAGETFDPAGMVVTATYSDATTDEVTSSCTFTPSGALATTDNTITVSYTEGGVTKTATQAITVNAYVQPTTIEITPNYEFWGKTGQFSGDTYSELEGSKDNVTLNWTRGSGSMYANTTAMRFYKDNDLTFTAPEGYEIISIELAVTGTYNDLTFSPTGYDNETTTWTGAAETVTMSRPSNASSYATISKFTITLAPIGSAVATTTTINVPANFNTDLHNGTAAGTLTASVTETVSGDAVSGATITWSSSNTSVATIDDNGAVTLVAVGTTTITASYAGVEDEYKPSSDTYEFTVTDSSPLANIAALTAQSAGDYNVALTNALVTYVNGTNAYLEDASGAVMLYHCAGTLAVGDKITGTASVTYTVYNNLPEVTAITLTGCTSTSGNTVTPTVITIADLIEDYTSYISRYVKIENATVTSAFSNKDCTITQNNSSINLRDQNNTATLTTTANSTVTVTAHPSIYKSTKQIAVYEQSQIVVNPTVYISVNDVNIASSATSGSITYTIENEPSPAGTLTATIVSGYTISNLSLGTPSNGAIAFTCDANTTSTARTAEITLAYTYGGSKAQVTANVTITQAAYVPAPTSDPYVRISSLDQLTDGSIVVIAARYDEEHTNGYKAMPSTMTSSKPDGYGFTSTTSGDDEILPSAIIDNIDAYYWVVNISEGNYRFTNANGDLISYGSSGTDFTTNGAKYAWSIARETSEETALVGEYTGFVITNATTTNRGFASNGAIFAAYSTSNIAAPEYNFFLDLFVQKSTPTTATYYYSANGTLGAAQTCAVGSTKTLETGTDLYSNFTFAGWTTAAYDVSSPISSYTFQDANPVTFYAVYTHNSNNYTRVFNETATSNIIIYGPAIIPSFATLDMGVYNLDYNPSPESNIPYILIEEGGQMIYHDDLIKMVIQKNFNAPTGTWGEDDNTGWYTFSSPDGSWSKLSEHEDFTLPAVGGVRQYDLYAYEESFGWYNKKNGSYINSIDEGVGYLYARAESLLFNLSGESYNDDVDLTNLSYTSRMGTLAGLHCIGNPYTHNIYKGVGITGDMAANYYALNEATGAWISTTDATPIPPMHAILVFVNKTDGTAAIHMTSDNSAPSSKANNDYIQFTVSNNQYEDVAYAWFDKGEGLNKINHRNSEVPMIYIPQGDMNYSIAPMADNTQSFNLNFKAMTTGKYTLSYKTQGEFNYMHIYDRLTGEDVDMLLEGEYSFIGSPSDNDARFIVRLGYTPNYDGDDNFVYQNGNDLIVNGEGELQIFDVMGRMVKNTVINGVETIAMPQGVYVCKLNGNVQKIVVR